jgi:DNA-binding transcriptional regulator LsrR (DeoR family)
MTNKSAIERSRLLFKISSLYYLQSLTQQDISEKLGISRPMVSRLLKQAREAGIVQIKVLPSAGNFIELEQDLESRYQLDEVIIIDSDLPESQKFTSQQIGVAAAEYLIRTIKDNDIIGVTWGTTIRSMVDAVHPIETNNIHVVQILGGLGRPESVFYPGVICNRLATLLNCSFTILPSPGVAGSKESKGAFLSDKDVLKALGIIKNVNVAFVGIGSMSNESITMQNNVISPADRDYLISRGAVGDIGLRFFDIHGDPVKSNFDDLVIGVTLEQIKNIRHVIGMAGGPEKFKAVQGVLRGKYLNVLITDVNLAKKLVESD